MSLNKPSDEQIAELMSWFGSKAELDEWAGPSIRFPFDVHTFREDLNLEGLDSFSMINPNNELLAFGQCYERLGLWHLGRLAVSPLHRGQGIVQHLIELLAEFGMREHAIKANSLFVLETNSSAIKAYEKCGFVVQQYPAPNPIENCLYMVRTS